MSWPEVKHLNCLQDCPHFQPIIELTTFFHKFSNYESTNLFTNISQLKKKTKSSVKKKSQFWAFEKIKTNITQYLAEKIRRFVFGKFVKTWHELDQWHFFDKFFKFFFIMITNGNSMVKTVSISTIDSLLVMVTPVVKFPTEGYKIV